MSAEDPGAWINARLSDAPPALLQAMRGALSPADAGALPDRLAAAALRLHAGLVEGEGGGGRGDALPLLAADALLTHALQAQAELDPEGLAGFVARWGARGALAGLLPAGTP